MNRGSGAAALRRRPGCPAASGATGGYGFRFSRESTVGVMDLRQYQGNVDGPATAVGDDGRGNRQDESGIGLQAVGVKGNMDAVGVAQVIAPLGRCGYGAGEFGLERRLVLPGGAVGQAIASDRLGLDCMRTVRRPGPEEGIAAPRDAEPPQLSAPTQWLTIGGGSECANIATSQEAKCP